MTGMFLQWVLFSAAGLFVLLVIFFIREERMLRQSRMGVEGNRAGVVLVRLLFYWILGIGTLWILGYLST